MPDAALTLLSHPLSSYCWKVLSALHEARTPFEAELVEGPPKASARFSALWPIGKMPLLIDAARGETVPETTIIIEYLQLHYPGEAILLPPASELQREVRLWDRFFDLYVHGPMQKLVADRMRPEGRKDPAGADEARATLDTAYAMLERRLETRTWAVGDAFTMADCAAMPALFYADAAHRFRTSHTALAGYLDRLVDRPAAQRILREARPYFAFFPLREALDDRFTSEQP